VNRETTVNRHQIERLRFIPGQDLLAADLRDLVAFHAQLGAWHNRAIHEAYGVRYGLRAVLGAQGVSVSPGLAYDAAGRVLLMVAARNVGLPDATTGEAYVLVIHVPPAGPRSCTERGLDLSAPVLSWRSERRWRSGGGVALCRLVPSGAAFTQDADFAPALARPLARPRIAAGTTVAGGTAWQLWQLATRPVFIPGIQVTVDTRASGFTRTPCYQAWLRGTLDLPYPNAPAGEKLYLPLRMSVSQENAAGFRVRVHLQAGLAGGTNVPDLLTTARQRLSVCWVGIQEEERNFSLLEVHHGHP
jgi:hypothetical protein